MVDRRRPLNIRGPDAVPLFLAGFCSFGAFSAGVGNSDPNRLAVTA
jgi:hypothetical protein